MPTAKEILDALEEIQAIRRELGLEQRVIKVPKGTKGRCEPGTKGRCIVCDKEYEAADVIRRCCFERTITTKRGVKRSYIVGIRVCYHCSPWTWDWQLERYQRTTDKWSERDKRYEDTGVFDHTNSNAKTVRTDVSRIEELNGYYEDDELDYLDRKIKKLEEKLK